MRSIGIDIGHSQIRLVEVSSSKKNIKLERFEIRNLGDSTGTDRDLEIIENLRELKSKGDWDSARICVALAQEQVALRNKIFPFTDRYKILKTLAFELEDELPFVTENSVFDAKLIRRIGKSTEVLAAATPKQHIEKKLALLKDGGIAPFCLSCESTAFANIFEGWYLPVPEIPERPITTSQDGSVTNIDIGPSESLRIVLQMGSKKTLVCGFRDSSLVSVRTLMWGGHNIIQAIAKKYNIPILEARREFEQKGFILNSQQQNLSFEAKMFSDLIARTVRDFVRDLQLSILEIKSEHQAEIEQVQMSGGLSRLKGLGPFLTQHLEVPVNRVEALELFNNVGFEKNEITQSRLAVAIGLAIDGLRSTQNPPINFLKNEYAVQSSFWHDLYADNKIYLQALAGFWAIMFVWAYLRSDFSQQLEDTAKEALKAQAKVAQVPGKSASESAVKKFIQENRKKILELKSVQSLLEINSALESVSQLSVSVPDRQNFPVQITLYNIQDRKVQIEGFSTYQDKDLSQVLKNAMKFVKNPKALQIQVGKTASTKVGPRTSFRVSYVFERTNNNKGNE